MKKLEEKTSLLVVPLQRRVRGKHGIKPGTVLTESHRNAINEATKKRIALGLKPCWVLAKEAVTPEGRSLGDKKGAEKKRGRPQRLETMCGKKENHKDAIEWVIYNTAIGVTFEGKNLNNIIRDNSELFEQKDLQWNIQGNCNASKCIGNLKYSKRTNNSWKGWMIKTPNVKVRGCAHHETLTKE